MQPPRCRRGGGATEATEMFRPRLPPDLDLTGLWDALLLAAAVAYVVGFVVAVHAALTRLFY